MPPTNAAQASPTSEAPTQVTAPTAAQTTVRPAADTSDRPPRRRVGVLLAMGVGFLVVALALSVAVGARPLAPADVWQALWRDDGSVDAGLVRELRLPRTALAVAVGAGLALAGSLLQAVTGNHLADPGLLGITSGAALGVVVAIAFAGVTTASGQIWFALAGALLATGLVMALGRGGAHRGPGTVQRQILAGVAVSAAGSATVSGIITARPEVFDRFRFWTVGSLADRGLADLRQLLPFLLVGAAIAFALGAALNACALGDAGARALGVPVGAVRAAALIAVALLCAAATSLAGPLTFVGLAVPHAVRALTGPDRRRELAGCLIAGPLVVLLTDVVGRIAAPPGEVQVGVVTAALGAPVFLVLVARRRVASA